MLKRISPKASRAACRLTALLGFMLVALGCVSGGDDGEVGGDIGVAVDRIEIDPSSALMSISEAKQFNATVHLSNGTTLQPQNADTSIAGNHQVTWSIDDSSIADVKNGGSFPGTVIARREGQTTLRASYEGVSVAASITVSAARILSIEVSPKDAQLIAGIEQQYRATGFFDDNTTRDITDLVVWSASPSSHININNTNRKGVAVGLQATDPDDTDNNVEEVLITATISDSNNNNQQHTNTVAAEVVTATLKEITVTVAAGVACGNLDDIPVGRQCQLEATAEFELSNGQTRFQDITQDATWSSDCSTSVTVTNSAGGKGVIESVAATAEASCPAAEVTITASKDGVDGTLAVVATPLAIVELKNIQRQDGQPLSGSIPAGLKRNYRAFAIMTDGELQDVTDLVLWQSEKSEFATIETGGDDAGQLTAVASSGGDSFEIRACVDSCNTSDPKKKLVIEIEVTDAVIQFIEVLPSNRTLAKGLTLAYNAIATYTDGTSGQDVTEEVKWCTRRQSDAEGFCEAVSNPNLVEIDNAAGNKGKLKPTKDKNAGRVTVIVAQAEDGSAVEGVTNLTLTNATVDFVTISPTMPEIEVEQQQQFTLTATYSDDSEADVTTQAVWQAENNASGETLVTISNSGGSRGLASAIKVGNDAIVRGSFGGKSAETTVTVIESSVLDAFSVHSVTSGISYDCQADAPANRYNYDADSNPFFVPNGYCRQFYVCGSYQGDRRAAIPNNQVDWFMFDGTTATANSNGSVCATQAGQDELVVRVRARHASGEESRGTFVNTDVVDVAITDLTVDPAALTLDVDESQQVILTGTFGSVGTLDLSTQAQWARAESGADTIATVSNSSVVTGKATGTGTATATVDNQTADVAVTVN